MRSRALDMYGLQVCLCVSICLSGCLLPLAHCALPRHMCVIGILSEPSLHSGIQWPPHTQSIAALRYVVWMIDLLSMDQTLPLVMSSGKIHEG